MIEMGLMIAPAGTYPLLLIDRFLAVVQIPTY